MVRYPKKFLARQVSRGQSLVEFALVVPLFFLLIFGIIDLGRVFWVEITLQNAMRVAGRYAVTGNTLPGYTSRVSSIQQVATQAAVGLNVSQIAISSVQGGTGANAAGYPNDTVTISLTTTLPLITPLIGNFFTAANGTPRAVTLQAIASFRNEPFPASQTSS
jgi:Flp pilus assembly protein TadG